MALMNHQNHTDVQSFGSLWKAALNKFAQAVSRYRKTRAMRRKKKIDRAAFMNLINREDWLYRDMGIHVGDVIWASKLPLEKNAAKELQKIRFSDRKIYE